LDFLFGNKNGFELVINRNGYDLKVPFLFDNYPSLTRNLPILVVTTYLANLLINRNIRREKKKKIEKLKEKNYS